MTMNYYYGPDGKFLVGFAGEPRVRGDILDIVRTAPGTQRRERYFVEQGFQWTDGWHYYCRPLEEAGC